MPDDTAANGSPRPRMKWTPARLAALSADALPRVVYVFGDEPLQRQEAEDRVRSLARAAGAGERVVHSVTQGFDWAALTESSQALSLFSERRLLEIHSEQAAWGRAGAEVLKALAGDDNAPDFLLLRSGALDRRQRTSAWFKALDGAGAVVEVRQLSIDELPGWLVARGRTAGIDLAKEAAALIADRVEGNLLAASQEVEKLALMLPGARIDLDTVLAHTTDSARFDVFALVDAAIAGSPGRSLRVLSSLRSEGVEPILVNWAFQRSLRQLAAVGADTHGGRAFDVACERAKVWPNQRTALRRALKAHGPARAHELLAVTRRIDRLLKAEDPEYTLSDPWRALSWLAVAVAAPATPIRRSTL